MSKKQKMVFWPSLVLIGLVVASVVFVSARSKRAADSKGTKRESRPATQSTLPEFKQRIRIWIHGDDVRPNVIHASPGKALVTIENETAADVSMQLMRVLPNRTQLIDGSSLPGRSKRLQREVMLVPGEYVFYDASRPTIRGRLIVDPR